MKTHGFYIPEPTGPLFAYEERSACQRNCCGLVLGDAVRLTDSVDAISRKWLAADGWQPRSEDEGVAIHSTRRDDPACNGER